MIGVTENLEQISDLLAKSALAAGREPGEVRLLAVSKKQSLAAIQAAAAAGQRDFGENFVQEGLEKIEQMQAQDLVWHFIGHLQSNKTRLVAEHFDWVHTVDKPKTAARLSSQRPGHLADLNICLQVNVDDEPGKSGVSLQALPELAAACRDLPRIQLRGLMCLPAVRRDASAQREPFRALRKALQRLQSEGYDLDTLSMGMSGDYDAAIAEGATIVRIGTALFGERPSS